MSATEQTPNHTPTPWRVEEGTTLIWGGCTIYDDGTPDRLGYPIFSAVYPVHWQNDRPNEAERRANAEFLVAAVNAHAETQARVEALEGWQPIETVPFKEQVDLWCIYGGEECATYSTGAVIGQLVSGRFKSPEYGWFGNQSDDGVPRANGPDLKPVAWRPAVPDCPAELIRAALSPQPTKAED